MNKLFLALLFVAGSFTGAVAQSLLKVRLSDNTPITVSVDGRYFNKRGTSITVGDLPYGNHTITIYSIARHRRGRAYQDIVYTGRVRTYQGMTTFFTYNPYSSRVNVYEQETVSDPYAPNANRSYDDNNRFNDRQYENENKSYNDIPGTKPDMTPDAATPQNQPLEPATDAPAASPPASPITPEQPVTLTDSKANKLKTKINAKATDTEKLKELKDVLKNERITTYQVSFIMDWLSFESSKVEFAKWAYDITVDKELYSDLAQKFTFKNTEEEFNTFLKGRQ
jgi:hypothetical protein